MFYGFSGMTLIGFVVSTNAEYFLSEVVSGRDFTKYLFSSDIFEAKVFKKRSAALDFVNQYGSRGKLFILSLYDSESRMVLDAGSFDKTPAFMKVSGVHR